MTPHQQLKMLETDEDDETVELLHFKTMEEYQDFVTRRAAHG